LKVKIAINDINATILPYRITATYILLFL